MTLSASYISSVTANACIVSDVLMTHDMNNHVVHQGPLAHVLGPGRSFRRKIFSPRPDIIFQYAGVFHKAASVARTIYENMDSIVNDNEPDFFSRLLSRYYKPSDFQETSLSLTKLCTIDGRKAVWRESLNYDQDESSLIHIHSAGTGKFLLEGDLYADELEEGAFEKEGPSDVIEKAVKLAMKIFLHNIHYPSELYSLHSGGWVELYEYRSSGFVPITFTINALRRIGRDRISLLRRISGVYIDGGLLLTSIDLNSLVNPRDFKPEFYICPDLYNPQHGNSSRISARDIWMPKSDYCLNVMMDGDACHCKFGFEDILKDRVEGGFEIDANTIGELMGFA